MAGLTKRINLALVFTQAPHLLRVLSKPALASPSSQHDRQQVRGFPSSKHWHPKYKKERGAKVLKVDLPVFVELKKDRKKPVYQQTPDELRKEAKKAGRLPPRTYQALPMNISCTRAIMDEYKPKPGDGRYSDIAASGLADYGGKVKGGFKKLNDVRKLKKYEDFQETDFAHQAQQIVVETNTLLQNALKNQDRLHQLVTEKAFPEMVHGLETKTLRWEFVETVEPPKVMQVRVEEMMSKENLFAQVTVRLHIKQILAIYDRFGRLMFGDRTLPKNIVEYVVMEKWITDTYGKWRIHGKIVPEDAPSRGVLVKTYRVPTFDPLPPVDDKSQTQKEKSVATV